MPLAPWMKWLLQFAGVFNLLAGFSMVVFIHEGYKLLGMTKPELVMPAQLIGILVALFGVGYLMVAADPLTNRNILLLGFWTKLLGPLLALYYVAVGKLPWTFVPLVFVADLVYLPPFAMIWLRLRRLALMNARS